MIRTGKEKNILVRMLILAVISIPLFAVLAGTPFFRFDFYELKNFLPTIAFTAVVTFVFWLINILLLLAGATVTWLKHIFMRAGISISLGIAVAVTGFTFYTPAPPPVQGRFAAPVIFPGQGVVDRIMPADSFGFSTPAMNARIPVVHRFQGPKPFFFPLTLRLLTINIIIFALCELVTLQARMQLIEQENVHLRQMNLEAQNSQLKMQLHPHFLFNSLNTLRLLIKKDLIKAEDYLLKLSDILRFSTTTTGNVVPVKEELNLCLTYLNMQQVRFGGMLDFAVTDPALYSASGQLPVYSLQLLVENAIKHNAFTTEDPLVIRIGYRPLEGLVTVRNRVRSKQLLKDNTGTGLNNLASRYRLLADQAIYVAERDGEFEVSIPILT